MLLCKHIAIGVSILASSLSTAEAVINLDFVYDSVADTTTALFAGFWDVFGAIRCSRCHVVVF